MVQRVLIANRGEIAVRVVQACRDLGMHSIAVFSEADRTCGHALLADEAICIGPPSASASYLNQKAVLAAAEITDADSIHPGYGFLAENAGFAESVEEQGLVWIGPRPATIRMLGDKSAARKAAHAAGVPVLPGTLEPPADVEAAQAATKDIGYPILLKAVSGGGGKGMRVVQRASEFERQFELASREADLAFGDSRVYLERFLSNPRHIEVQVFGESVGSRSSGEPGSLKPQVVAVGARECSIQRRHQKLLEEAPPAGCDATLLQAMQAAAVKLASSVGYVGAGTVEFLLDGNSEFFFMEMNTRIQVEHPVTEMVTATDLVVAQLRCAQGRPSGLPDEIESRGHAIECRLNAEDPSTFVPSPGLISKLRWPTGPGVRIDSHVYEGYRFPPYYDSLLGKIVVWGEDRGQAVRRMSRALAELKVEGISTTAALHRAILHDERFAAAEIDTGYLAEFLNGRARI